MGSNRTAHFTAHHGRDEPSDSHQPRVPGLQSKAVSDRTGCRRSAGAAGFSVSAAWLYWEFSCFPFFTAVERMPTRDPFMRMRSRVAVGNLTVVYKTVVHFERQLYGRWRSSLES